MVRVREIRVRVRVRVRSKVAKSPTLHCSDRAHLRQQACCDKTSRGRSSTRSAPTLAMDPCRLVVSAQQPPSALAVIVVSGATARTHLLADSISGVLRQLYGELSAAVDLADLDLVVPPIIVEVPVGLDLAAPKAAAVRQLRFPVTQGRHCQREVGAAKTTLRRSAPWQVWSDSDQYSSRDEGT